MKNPECTERSQKEAAELLRSFPQGLSEEEESLARQFFQPIVFFRQSQEDRHARRCVCTSCLEGFYVHKQTSPDFFRATHGKACVCPNCGQKSTLAAMGKFGNFSSLTSQERAVQLSACGGWLLVQAGWISRTFDREDLGGDLEFEPFRRYAFAPGKRMMWSRRTVSWSGGRGTDGPWTRADSVREPFQPLPDQHGGTPYIPLGFGAVAQSALRWCQYDRWFNDTFGGYVGDLDFAAEPFRIAYLIRYLAEYTRRPQMEFLAKLGRFDILNDLILHKKPHGNQLDWNAKSPPDFFRMSKQEYRAFAGSDLRVSDLACFRAFRKSGGSLEEFFRAKETCGLELDNVLHRCAELGVGLGKAVRYLERQGDGAAMARFWRDYLDAARRLDYDLSRPDTAMPKDLRARHDAAAAAVRTVVDAAAAKAYAVRRQRLTEQFAFALEGLCVRVPQSVGEIVEEGRALRHCVGGYAARHANGKVTILFLRKIQNPEAPYVTMELTAEENCSKLRIVQIHGFCNDCGAPEPPEARHKDFLETWLAWVHSGSPRREDGAPDIPETAEARQEIA